MSRFALGALVTAALAAIAVPAQAADDILRLPIGDPARRDRTAPLVLDAITETASGAALTPADLPARIAGVRILFVGEAHVAVESHAVELAVIRELVRTGRKVSVGLEMYPVSAQASLDDWTAGKLSEADFLEKSGWFGHWSYNWNYYRDIFVFARDNGVRLFGANVPPEIVSAVGRKGLDSLEPADRALLPQRVDWDNADFKRLFKASFDEDEFHGGMTDDMLNRMVQAQATWDAAFGWSAVRAARASDDPKAIVVMLVGEGHVYYGLGAERQARLWFSGKTATLVPVAISDHEKGKCSIEAVQASLADFVWGVPEEDATRFPLPGFATRFVQTDGQISIIQVDKKSAAAKAGLKVGDRLLEIDGRAVAGREGIHRAFAEKRWGDAVKLAVARGTEKLSLDVLLRRERPEPCKAK